MTITQYRSQTEPSAYAVFLMLQETQRGSSMQSLCDSVAISPDIS